jgi:monofunctional biosynthetic peptidoglycan transglycosylase
MRRWLFRAGAVCAAALVVATAMPLGWLSVQAPFTSAFMLWSRIEDPATGRACSGVRFQWVDGAEIASDVRRAVVAAEDQRFLEHHGLDFASIERAVSERGGGLRGASTITQQLAKNLFLWPGRSFVRKGLEVWYALWMELLWSKRKILELYLNVAQFGPCLFGVEAAAQQHFGVRAADLSALQATRLAAVLPSPGKMRAADPGEYTEERAQEILALMQDERSEAWLHGL